MVTIGEKIREMRDERGHTQKYLAEELEISIGILSKVESSERMPSLTFMMKLSKYYGFSLDTFLRDTIEERQLNKDSKYTQIGMSFSL